MSKNMESKAATPSVIARLMGLDELPSQQLVKKQKRQRVLSETYLRKVASIGAWEKRSFRFIEEQTELMDVDEEIDPLERDKERVKLGSSQEKIPFLRENFINGEHVRVGTNKPDYLAKKNFFDQEDVPSHLQSGHVRILESAYALDCERANKYKKISSKTHQGNAKLLQKLENCLVKDPKRKYGSDSTSTFLRFGMESNSERHHSFRNIVVLKPKPEKAENAASYLSSTNCSKVSCPRYRNHKLFHSHGKGNSLGQVRERKNLSNGVKPIGHRGKLSCEIKRGITGKTKHSDISMEPPRLGFSGVNSLEKEPELIMVSSPNYSDLNYCCKPSCNYVNGSYVSNEAKKKISERWRMTKEFGDNGVASGGSSRSKTLGEMLTLSENDKCAKVRAPIGINSSDGWKNGGVGDLVKSRSSACSTSVESPKSKTSHKALNDDSYLTSMSLYALNRSTTMSSKQGSSEQNSGAKCKKSQSSTCLELEKHHLLEDIYVVNDLLKNKLEKHDSSEPNSMVSKSLKVDIVFSEIEDKITPTNQLSDIKDGNISAKASLAPESSMPTAASPSMIPDMVFATENASVAKSIGCTISEKNYDSSPCVLDGLSPQEDISTEMSEECITDPDSLVSSEAAYQPSPVSVLEAPFEEEILSNSECFQSINSSLHDFWRQLEFLKSESYEGYSEGPGMVVSSEDGGAAEESLEDNEINENLTKLFGVEYGKDFSYMIDVLNEAGFHSRDQDIGFDGWHSPEIPINSSVFETLEKKYGEQITWKRSSRRLLFDRVNSGLAEILQHCLGEPMWAKPVARRLSFRQNLKEIQKELCMFLVSQEKEARKDSSEKVLGKDDGWLFLGYEIEVISREIENSLVDELAAEIVTLESF